MKAIIIIAATLAVTGDMQAQENLRPDVPVAFVGGMLLDGYEAEPTHHAVVAIDDGRIVATGTKGATDLPGDAVVIDLGAPFQVLALRERIDRGEIPGPRLTISGPWITRVYLDSVPDEYQILIDSPREAAQRTRELIEHGSDVIKTWEGLTEDDYHAIVAAAHKQDIKVHAHLYEPAAIRAAIAAGVDVFQHVGSAGNPLANIDAMQHVDIVVRDGVVWYAESVLPGPVTEVGHSF